MLPDFKSFHKIPRLFRPCLVQEKIDGSNGTIYISDAGEIGVASRNKWITPEDDNFGFARWAYDNKESLLSLGPGWHRGEWFGAGIQRGYGLKEKRFALFRPPKKSLIGDLPSGVSLVPTLTMDGLLDHDFLRLTMRELKEGGSRAVPGYMNPEGIVVTHTASGQMFKVTFDEETGDIK